MVEEDLIGAAQFYHEMGCFGLSGGSGAGPWGGSEEGRMIESAVGCLTNWLVYRDTLIEGGYLRNITLQPTKEEAVIDETSPKPMDVEWKSFAVHKALQRNTNQIYYSGLWGGNRIYYDMTSESYLLRVALSSIRTTILGLNFRVGATNPPTYTNWVIETSDAAIKSGIGLEDFVQLRERVQKEKLKEHPFQPILQDQRMYIYGENPSAFLTAGLKAYDWYRQTPTEAYLKSAQKVRSYLRDIGLNI
jgi:hypothetical protein